MKSSGKAKLNLADLRGLDADLRALKGSLLGARQRAVREAAARVLVLRGYGPHRRAREVNLALPRGDKLESDRALWKITGGWRGLVAILERGGLFPGGLGGGWSEGLIAGLRLSGALRRQYVGSRGTGPAVWRVKPIGGHPALGAAFLAGGLPFACRVAVGRRGLVLWGFWGGRLGASDPGGAEVMAGLLMGCRPMEAQGRLWMGVGSSVGSRALLASWGIPVAFPGVRLGRGRFDLVSPFWGALFAWMMPEAARPLMGGWGLPGSCPLLPWAFLRMAGGSRVSDGFPRAGLPYLVSRKAMWVRGVPLGDIHERAVRELGMVRVDPRMRRVWAGHMGSLGLAFPFAP